MLVSRLSVVSLKNRFKLLIKKVATSQMHAAEEPQTKQINKTKTILTTNRAINDDVKKLTSLYRRIYSILKFIAMEVFLH